jgi:hypothetical protein
MHVSAQLSAVHLFAQYSPMQSFPHSNLSQNSAQRGAVHEADPSWKETAAATITSIVLVHIMMLFIAVDFVAAQRRVFGGDKRG